MTELALLYELAAADGTRFSPYSWRTRWGLRHKGLEFQSIQIDFPDIAELGGDHRTVPVIRLDDAFVEDSWDIARFLDARFPDAPALLGDPIGVGATRFVERFSDKIIQPAILRLLARDIFDRMAPRDQAYFRRTREEILGCTLEDAQATRDQGVQAFRKAIHPVRLTLGVQPWLAGEAPGHADYIIMAAFQWARLSSDFEILKEDDPVFEWFQRGLELHDGFGRKVHPRDGGHGFAGSGVWKAGT